MSKPIDEQTDENNQLVKLKIKLCLFHLTAVICISAVGQQEFI